MPLRINPNVVWQADDDEVRLYDTESADFRTLNSTAAEIWRLVDHVDAGDEIARRLAEQFAGDDPREAQTIHADVTQFLAELTEAGLLIEVSGKESGHG